MKSTRRKEEEEAEEDEEEQEGRKETRKEKAYKGNGQPGCVMMYVRETCQFWKYSKWKRNSGITVNLTFGRRAQFSGWIDGYKDLETPPRH